MLVALLGACSGTGRDIPPPLDSLNYPTAIVSDPAGDHVYVVSTNFDSRYTGGTIVPLDVATQAFVPEGAVEVGAFAGDLALVPAGDRVLAFLAVRNESLLTRLQIDRVDGVPRFSCGPLPTNGDNPTCDDDHVVEVEDLYQDPEGDEQRSRDPFAVAAGAGSDVAPRPVYLGSLVDGVVQLFTMADDGAVTYDSGVVLVAGIHSLVEHSLVSGGRVVYVSNRMANRIDLVDVGLGTDGSWRMTPRAPFVLPQSSSTGDYFRGMALSSDRRTLFVAFRSPSSLVALDIEPDGSLALRGLVPLAGSPSQVAVYAPGGDGDAELVYVTDFYGDAVYVVDPRRMEVEDRIEVGNGPYGIAIAGDRAFVTDFEDHAVSVIPLDPASPDRHREAARLK